MMSDPISCQTVIEVARLARIDLTPSQVSDYQQQLNQILDYVGQLSRIEMPPQTTPFFGAAEAFNAVRNDVVLPSLPRQTILQNAPATDGEYYLVPPVFP